MDNSNNQKMDNSNNQKIDNSNNQKMDNSKINDYDGGDNFNYFYQDDEIKNLCLDCGMDMGPTNPRQLCGKTHCNNL